MKAIFGRKIRLGRLSIPIWAILAVPAVALAAGQALGPVLAGSVTGSAGLTVAQAITLDVDNLDLDERIVVNGADDAVTWQNSVRGGLFISLTWVLPVVGWLGMLPLTLAAGLGCLILGFVPLRPAAAPAPAISPPPTMPEPGA